LEQSEMEHDFLTPFCVVETQMHASVAGVAFAMRFFAFVGAGSIALRGHKRRFR